MIVSRAPVRFTLGGGGTDLPAYSRAHGGFVVAAAVDKFVFVCVARRFYETIRLAYSETETVDSVDKIQHRLYRAALKSMGLTGHLELHSLADVPANTGLGSSSSFAVALLNGLHAFQRRSVPAEQLAREACHLEIDVLEEPIGKQDQYIAAYGGISALTFHPDGSVDVERLPLRDEVIDELESNLVIYYSGVERSASSVLAEQQKAIAEDQDAAVERMHRIKALGYETRRILLAGDLDSYGEMLHEHWQNKRKLATSMASGPIDEHYQAARKAGAIGGKLMGAGGGGFFMFYVRAGDRRRVHEAMAARGLRHLRFRFDFDGARIMANFHRS
jgi:D-glycero-alpha-D-manno-heptose-7-phosphate kinase